MLHNLRPGLLLTLLFAMSCDEQDATDTRSVAKPETEFNISMLSVNGQEAYRDIDTAERFCSEHIGWAGATPSVVNAFRTLLKEDHADDAFESLLRDATMAGKLYALCGLYYTDSAYFQQAVQPFRTSGDTVTTFMGCIVSRDSVRFVVETTEPNTVHLSSRNETIEEWRKRTGASTMQYDIIGGAWPNIFKESGGLKY